MISLIPEESIQRLQILFGKRFSLFNKDEVQALVTADLEKTVDNARMREICGGHTTDMTHLLQGLVAKSALIQEGQGRWSRYRLPDSVHKPFDSVHKPFDSIHKLSNSIHSEGLLAIAAPMRERKRLNTKETESIILELCQERSLTRNQIAELLNRNPDALRSRFLTPMVAHGQLRLRYPDKPNRVDQAYTANTTEHHEQ